MPRAQETMANSFDLATAGGLEPRLRDLVERRRAVLGPGYRLFYERPVEVVRGEGVHLYDADGDEYLDAYNNVPCVGHAHPRVVEAIARQAATLNTHTRYLQPSRSSTTPSGCVATHAPAARNVMFTCTGSEANDLALRVARYRDRRRRRDRHARTPTTASPARSRRSRRASAPNVPLGHERPRDRAARHARRRRGGRRRLRGARRGRDRRPRAPRRRAWRRSSSTRIFSTDGILPDPAGFLRPAVDVVRARRRALRRRRGPGRLRPHRRRAVGLPAPRHRRPTSSRMGKPMGNGLPIAAPSPGRRLIEPFGTDGRATSTPSAETPSRIAAAQPSST